MSVCLQHVTNVSSTDETFGHMMFMGPCIVIYFYNETNYMHNFSILLNITQHVSDGLSVHNEGSKIVHTASSIGLCHTGSLNACAVNEPV